MMAIVRRESKNWLCGPVWREWRIVIVKLWIPTVQYTGDCGD